MHHLTRSAALCAALALAAAPAFADEPIGFTGPIALPGGASSVGKRLVTPTDPLPVTCPDGTCGSSGSAATPFTPVGDANLTPGTTSTNVAVPPTSTLVTLTNNSGQDLWYAFGTSSGATATTSNSFLGAGRSITLAVGSNTYVAAVTSGANGSTNGLKVQGGTGGNPALAGGSGAATIASGADAVEGATTDTSASNTIFGTLKAILANSAAPPVPNPVTSTDHSGVIGAGNTFQTLLASSSARKGCALQNPADATETLYVFVGSGTATKAAAFQLAPGQSFNCLSGFDVITDAIQITAATTGHAFPERDQ